MAQVDTVEMVGKPGRVIVNANQVESYRGRGYVTLAEHEASAQTGGGDKKPDDKKAGDKKAGDKK